MVQRGAGVGVGQRVAGIDLQQRPVQRQRVLVALLPEARHGQVIERFRVARRGP